MKYLMGIDNGGTFSKAALFDEDGKQISVASVPTVTITPKPGYTERDMDELWEVNAQAVRNAIEKSNIDPKDIHRIPYPVPFCKLMYHITQYWQKNLMILILYSYRVWTSIYFQQAHKHFS